MTSFADHFYMVGAKFNSALCVGLDLDPRMHKTRLLDINKMLVDRTAGLAPAYKLNMARYELVDGGDKLLADTIAYVRQEVPKALVIVDSKRVDVGTTGIAYAARFRDRVDCDAVTVHPWMGYDTVLPYLNSGFKSVFVVCRSSNPYAGYMQDIPVKVQGVHKPMYLYVAEQTRVWGSPGRVGLVVGATALEAITRVRNACPNMFLLLPGVGAQGGDAGQAARRAADGRGGGYAIAVSRQIADAAMQGGRASLSISAQRSVQEVAEKLREQSVSNLANPANWLSKALTFCPQAGIVRAWK